jgi:hypothetical protein
MHGVAGSDRNLMAVWTADDTGGERASGAHRLFPETEE